MDYCLNLGQNKKLGKMASISQISIEFNTFYQLKASTFWVLKNSDSSSPIMIPVLKNRQAFDSSFLFNI